MNEENSWFDKSNLRIFVLFVLAFSFIYLDGTNQKYFKKTKSLINDAVSQASYVVTWPIRELLASPSYIKSIIVLKKNNEEINNLKNKVEELIVENNFLKLDSQKLKDFLAEEESYSADTVQAKIILRSKGIFSQSIVINRGSKEGVKNGSPIVKNNFLIGQVLEANFQSSRVMLLTDINSRIPVLIGGQLIQAILVGDPSSKSKVSLQYLPKKHKLENGDKIYTSDIEGFLKRGILIGSIVEVKQNETNKMQNYLIQLHYNSYQADYVSVFVSKK
jgi:rod shape-determining protein MreC